MQILSTLPSLESVHQIGDEDQTDEKMFRKLSSHLHLQLLALLFVALIISIATLACAATTLNLFNSQQSTNPWLLPLWRSHFDLRGLKLVVGTSVAIALFDSVAIVVLSMLAVQVITSFFTIPVRLSFGHKCHNAKRLRLPAY